MGMPFRPPTPAATRAASRRAWGAWCGCLFATGCGALPGLVTYPSGATPPAIAAAASPTAPVIAAPVNAAPVIAAPMNAAPEEPQRVVPVAHHSAGLQEETDDNGAAAALPAPMPAAMEFSDGIADAAALTLAEVEAAAMANNPTLAGAAAAVRKARGLSTQVGLAPNPTVGVHADDIGEDGGAGRYGVFASQTFVRGNKLALSRAVESWEIRRLQAAAETQRLRVRTDVRRRFVDVLAAQRRVEIAAELVTLAAAGVTLAEDLFDAGEVARPDVLQARVQAGEVRIAQRDAEIARDAAWRRLMAAAGTPGRPLRPVAGTLKGTAEGTGEGESILGDFDELLAGIVANSPEIAAARVRLERAKAAVCRQRVQAIPNVTAQASLAYGADGREPIGGFQLGVPLPVRNDNRGNVAAAIADVHRASADLARLELDLRAQARRGAGRV